MSKDVNVNKWTKVVREWQESGKSQREFCKDQGISYWTFRNWNIKLKNLKSEMNLVPVPFVEVRVDKVKSTGMSKPIKIYLPCGIAIAIDPETDELRIANILRAAQTV
jgi:hypothetical protein